MLIFQGGKLVCNTGSLSIIGRKKYDRANLATNNI
jgi:hypothetical protein